MLAVVFVIAPAACGHSTGTPGNLDADADAEMDAAVDVVDGRSDQRPDVMPSMPTCATARTVCKGPDVLACVDGQPGPTLQTCADACSLGRCTTAACSMTETTEGVRGCRFFGAQVDNVDTENGRPTMLLISNAGAGAAAVQVQLRDATTGWAPIAQALVMPGKTQRIEIARPLLDLGLIPGGGYRIESDAPVMVVELIGDNFDRMSRSSGGTVLRPIQALGLKYLALTAAAQNSLEVARTAGSRNGAGAIAIVGTVPNTAVRLGVTAVVAVQPGGILQPRGPGDPLSDPIMLDEGDVLQIFSVDSGGDLTGTLIDADMPVAVFSGNVFTSYGAKVTGFNGADMVMEQVPPTNSWSTGYLGIRLAPEGMCDSFFEGAASWRVLSSTDGNEVTLLPAPGVTFDIPGVASGTNKFVLGKGMAQSFFARGDAPNFELSADYPVLLAQWLDCEPSMAWGIDTRLSMGDLPFGLPPGFQTEMVVVRKKGSPLTLDDGRLSLEALFQPVADGSNFEVARIGAGDLSCPDKWADCDHRLSGLEFGAGWRGMDVVCSYMLTIPSWRACALPNVSVCPK